MDKSILSSPTSPQGPLELTQGEAAIHHPAPEREGEIAARESLEPEGPVTARPIVERAASGRAERLDGGERPAPIRIVHVLRNGEPKCPKCGQGLESEGGSVVEAGDWDWGPLWWRCEDDGEEWGFA